MKQKSLFSHLFFVLLITTIPFSSLATDLDKKGKASENSPTVFYSSTQSEGYIGATDTRPFDSPVDNVFEVILDEQPAANSQVWLTYELYGVHDHTSVSRSVNDQLSIGGHFVKESQQWSEQNEQISADWLKEGKNIVRFTLPENATYHYRIRNLGFLIQPGDKAPPLVINQSIDKAYYERQGYLKGYVTSSGNEGVRVFIDGEEVQVLQSEFEGVSINHTDQPSWQSSVKVIYADGSSTEQQVEFAKAMEADHQNSYSSFRVMKAQKEFIPNEDMELFLHGAAIQLPSGSLVRRENITITALRNIDIPSMDMGLVNVTKGFAAYRFLPHGARFQKNARVILDYDPGKIPSGYTEKDIKTYYFNEETRHWVALPREEVNAETGRVVSITDHFTDMISGILMVPESPETEGYLSTSIKDLSAANPAAAINLLEPPEASAMGSAGMNYPLNVPAGRRGIQSELEISYDNEGGNGWLGLGWSMNLPALTIDTRWGVPRYDAALETETYMMDGQQLSPVTHRGALQPRSAEKRFFPRIEGGFNRIIRHGTNPKNYWWEMTNKSGTRYFYGGKPGTGVDHSAVLKDASGNIAHWALSEVRDLTDNFMSFKYVLTNDAGVSNGSVSGFQLYIDHITYTGQGNTEGAYKVTFIRDKSLGEIRRSDVIIDARLGFKQVTADLLRRVEVSFNNQPVRSYVLNYEHGAFFKTLLTSLQEFDASGILFTTHDFEYYDDVRQGGVYKPFDSEENWNPQSDNVKGNFINPLDAFNDDASAISGTKSWSAGGGLAVTIGPYDGNNAAKSFTVGGQFGVSFSESDGMLSLIDINGDGLADKVFDNGGGLSYRPNQSGPDGATTFGPARPIIGVNSFSKSSTLTFNFGAQANVDPLFIGYDGSISTTTEKVYFSDVNGDGLIDIIDNGVAWFNHLNADGDPVFTQTSADTPSAITEDFTISGGMIEEDPEEQEFLIDQNPLHDVVRVWKAPFNGMVSIEGDVTLLPGTSGNPDDGVRVAVQLKGLELWGTIIGPGDFTPKMPAGLGSVMVSAGDRLYFRVQSIENGLNDQVHWNPIVTYTDRPQGIVDANDQTWYAYTAEEGFVLTADQTVSAPMAGSIRVEGMLSKPQTSDDVTATILFNGAPIWEETYTWDEEVDELISFDVNAQEGDSFKFQVSSNTNVRWTDLLWNPSVYYTSFTDPGMQVTNASGEPLVAFMPVVHYTIYPAQVQEGPDSRWIALEDTTISITPVLTLASATNEDGVPYIGEVTFSIKKANELVTKQTFQISNIQTNGTPIQLAALAGDTLFMEFHAPMESMELARAVSASQVIVDGTPLDIALFTLENDYSFGPLYRHWGQFAYDGNRERANLPINEADLEQFNQAIQEEDVPDVEGIEDLDDLEALEDSESYSDPSTSKLIVLFPSIAEQRWKGRDDFTYVTATEISASRNGLDDLSSESAVVSGSGIRGIKRKTKSNGNSLAGGLGQVSVSGGWDSSTTQIEFMDMNGDSYPDIVTQSSIQYTFGSGALDPTPRNHGLEVHGSTSAALGITLSGSYVKSKNGNSQSANPGTSGTSQAQANQKGGGAESSKATKQAILSVGLSGNGSLSNDVTEASWMDINGDGLPDKVYRDGEVALNLGYSFAPKEPWGYEEIRQGLSIDYGAGLGINIKNGSITAGISLNRSENEANLVLQDVNGDGLVDIIMKSSPLVDIAGNHPLLSGIIDGPDASIIKDIFTAPADIVNIVENLIEDPSEATLTVALNTGNGFASPVIWEGGEFISKGASTGEGVNIGFTFCITLIPPVPVAKLCFNPSGNGGQGASREWAQLTDINGDGYPDALYSEKDNELKVRRSTIGRTNMLRTVKRPLGGEFTLDYERVGNTYDLQESKWVLNSVAMNDGVPGDGADVMKSSFEYEDGYYDRNERQFYGFQKVKSHELDTENGDQVYRSVVQEYNIDDYYRQGLLSSEITQDAQGNRFLENDYTYLLQDVVTGNPLPLTYVSDDAGAAFPAMTSESTSFYEGQSVAQKSTQMTYGYDAFGNVINYTDFSDVGPDDDLSAQITYHNIPAAYIVEVPQSIVAVSNGQIYRKRTSQIDLNTGLITQMRLFSEDQVFSDYDLSYDVYGNLSALTNPSNDLGQRLSYNFTYDNQVNTYIEGVADSYGYASSKSHDYRFGELLSTTDMNGQHVQFSLDDVGRVTSVTGPLELHAGVPYTISYQYDPDANVPWALTRNYDPANPGNDIEITTFVDGLGREVQMKKDGAIFQPQGFDQEVMIVSGTTIFDAFGRQVADYHPVVEAKGASTVFNADLDGINPTVTTYDILDRPLVIILPDGTTNVAAYDFGYDRDGLLMFRSTHTDANGIWMESFTDVDGDETAFKKQYTQGSDVWTSYDFNPMDELEGTVNDLGHVTSSQFDWLGRRTQVNHPDAGITTFRFDKSSNLTEKRTANLQNTPNGIVYQYDHQRLVSIDYPNNPQNNVNYTYGASGAAFNRAGRVVTQQDASGRQELFYNPLGALVKDVRTITVPGADPLTYVTEWEYDTWDRISKMVYPDGELLSYSYNAGGLLQSISGSAEGLTFDYLEQLGYDKFEDRIIKRYGNGTSSSYTYESDRRRLNSMITITANNRRVMDNVYTYDNQANLLRIQNKSPRPSANQLGGRSDYEFSYDDLYRLTSASGLHVGKNQEARFSLNMTYNTVGGILNKEQVHDRKAINKKQWGTVGKTTYSLNYSYDGSQPNTPTGIGDKAYSYDANGNQAGWESNVNGQRREIIWDEENRIQTLTDNGAQFNYVYDATGERVLKGKGQGKVSGGNNTGGGGIGNYTIYVNPFMVVESGKYSKHYFIESERIASRLGNNDSSLEQNNTKENGKNKTVGQVFIYYYHSDHLSSTSYLTDVNGEVYQHMEYFPFGETFIEERGNNEETRYLFNSKELDGETGLYYYGARYYDPVTSLWPSVDPMAEAYPGISGYAYVANNPIVYIDPDGRMHRRGSLGGSKSSNKKAKAGAVDPSMSASASSSDSRPTSAPGGLRSLAGDSQVQGGPSNAVVENPSSSSVSESSSESSASSSGSDEGKVDRLDLIPTHEITKTKKAMKTLFNDIRENGIKEPIKYVVDNGEKYVVDGHHRFYSAQKLGIQRVPAQEVKLPYLGYKNSDELTRNFKSHPGFWKYMK